MTSRTFCLSIAAIAICVAASAAPQKETDLSGLNHKPQKKSRKQRQRPAAAPLAGSTKPVQPGASTSRPDAAVNSSWNGGTGNWNVNADWTPGSGFPNNGGGNTYNVTIGTGNDNVSLNTNVTISSLTLGTSSGASILQNLANTTETLNDLGVLTINSGGQFTFEKGSGLTVGNGGSNAGYMDLDQGSSAAITGNFTNTGQINTNRNNLGTSPNTFSVTGTLTNNPGAQINLGSFNNTADVMTAGTLVNNGFVSIGTGSTLTLTNGITDVVAGSEFDVLGTFKKGTGSALAGLGGVEGNLYVENGQNTSITPGGGTLTVSSTGLFDVDRASNVTVSGNVTNSGLVNTNRANYQQGDTLTVTGGFTNNTGAQLDVGFFNNTSDVMNVGTLTNHGYVSVGIGSTLNLTSQPNGITDVVAGSEFDILGTFKAGAASAIAKLAGVEGIIYVENGQSTTITPGGGTLNVASSGLFDVDHAANVTVSGNVTNSGLVNTNRANYQLSDTLTVTGGFTNNSGAQLNVGFFNNTTDVMNVATLTNNGNVSIGIGSALNLTGQPNGITDVVAGSEFDILGTFKAGAASAVAKLAGVEGTIYLENGQSTTITPGGGTLNVASSGLFDVDHAANVTVSGNVTNSGLVYTNRANYQLSDTLTVTGGFTNSSGAQLNVGFFNDATDVMNVATLTNNGYVSIGIGSTLNLTSQPNGITDVVAGSEFDILGTFKAGAASAVAKLAGVEGTIYLENGQSATITPGGGTLNVASSGLFDVDHAANVTVSGNVTNSGLVYTNRANYQLSDTLTVTGGFTNSSGAQLNVGFFNDATDVMNIGTLTNNGLVTVGTGSTLNLTNQPNGITDVVAGSEFDVLGTFKAGAASAVAKLNSVEGTVFLENGQSTTITPGGGTLTVAGTGVFDVDRASNVTISGNVTNSGQLDTNRNNYALADTLTVTGKLTNNSGAQFNVGYFNNNTNDLANLGTLANNGTVAIEPGSTLNLTSSGADTNAGTITLTGSTLKISGANVTLSGAGSVTMSNAATNLITGGTPTVTFTNGNTIQGAGTISNMGIVNTGKIIANQSTPLVILPSSAGLTNNGTLTVNAGDLMQIGTSAGGALTNLSGTTLTGGIYSVGGTLQFGAPGTSITTDAANISLTGPGAKIVDFSGSSVLTNLATIASTGSLTFGNSWGTFTTTGNLTNNGTLTVGASDKFIVNLAHSLTNFSGTTLTGGIYKITGTLQFAGANIVTNAANITLTGAGSKIVNQSNANGLANFAVNNAGASFTLGTGRSFTTVGDFTNNGSLVVGGGDTFKVNGNLTNFSGTTLTGGSYTVSGILQFNGANIAANAANITLNGSAAKIVNQSSANAMLGFNSNLAAGKFTLSGNANLTTTGGAFTNAGLFTVSAGSTFTVGGGSFGFTQSAGTSTIDGALTASGAGSFALNGGFLFGNGTVNYAVVDTGLISPGDSVSATGKLAVGSTYTQNAGGALSVTIGGTTAGTKYDQLNVTGAANLNGTLNISLASGFTPTVGSTFDILNASSISGNFSTINGLSINGTEHFTETTIGGNEIVLTVVSGAASTSGVRLTKLVHPGVVKGRYGRQVYGGQRSINMTAVQPVAVHVPAIGRGFRPRDEFGPAFVASVPAAASTPASGNAGAFLSPAVNPMAAMNHMHFECGVDLNALLKTSPKRLLRSPWTANIGYMSMTPAR